MSNMDYIHLRVRSSYSLLESSMHIEKIRDLCLDNEMPALGLTDNNLFGALEFSEKLADSGIQPIIGTTLNVYDKDQNAGEKLLNYTTICLISNSLHGYKNLLKLSSSAYQKQNSLLPFVSLQEVFELNQGLFFLTGGTKGIVNQSLRRNKKDLAVSQLKLINKNFQGRLFIELQRYDDNETNIENNLIDIAYDMNLPIVATNDIFFSSKEDHEANDILQCIPSSDVLSNPNRKKISSECFFKNQKDMKELFSDIPEAIENSILIAKRCLYRPETLAPILPKYISKEQNKDSSSNENDLLRELTHIGFRERINKYGIAENSNSSEYQERLNNELSIIIDMDYSGYFLIVADIINWSKKNSIPVGPGRGSGAGSLVAWSLGITDLDPIKFNLVFERFLNPHRVSMPDFDIDFCPIRRDEVINYIKEKYGKKRVAQIITFGKLQARAVIRDVGRVMELPYSQVDNICRLIPNNPANPMTLTEAISEVKEIKSLKETDETINSLLTFSLSLEGLYRHASTHAAGIVISDGNLEDYVPLYMDQKTNSLVTQFNMKWVEEAGLVKFDILGLKTLSVISECCKQIENNGASIDISTIQLDDENTLNLFKEGSTSGVFQFESSGMRDLLIKAKPNNFEDLIALIALFRPGPMENIPQYLAAKNSEVEIEELHELINPIIADTYGVIIYQEQVIQIAQRLASYSAGEADLLRRAMGKKIKSEMDAQRDKFIAGANLNGVDKVKAELIFDLVDKFAGYGFNKAHSAAYALISFQTAYLKANHPLAFMSALLTLDIGNIDKVSNIISEIKRMNIKILPPSINSSGHDFKIEGESIRFSLASIKNVGSQAVANISYEREKNGVFKSIKDFITRVDAHFVNKRAFEGLIMAGAFDEIEVNRALLFNNVDLFLMESNRIRRKNIEGQIDIFSEHEDENQEIRLPSTKEWSEIDKLKGEFEFLGAYLSGHPMEKYSYDLINHKVSTYTEFIHNIKTKKYKQARLAGVIQNRVNRRGKTGRMYSFIKLSDISQEFETMFFSDMIDKYNDLIYAGNVIIIKVDADIHADTVRLRVTEVIQANINEKVLMNGSHKISSQSPDEAFEADRPEVNLIKNEYSDEYTIKLANIDTLDDIANRLKSGRGSDIVNLIFYDTNLKKDIKLGIGNSFNFDSELKTYLQSLPGVELFNKQP